MGLGTGFANNRAPALGLICYAWHREGLAFAWIGIRFRALGEGGFASNSDRVMIRILIGSLAR